MRAEWKTATAWLLMLRRLLGLQRLLHRSIKKATRALRRVAFSETGSEIPERYFSSSIVTATSAFAESLTLSPSTPATRLLSMKW
jgi:hypothetical protein